MWPLTSIQTELAVLLHEFRADQTGDLLQREYSAVIALSIGTTDLIRAFLNLELYVGTHALEIRRT